MFTSFDAASGAETGADEFASAASPAPFVGRIETVAGVCTLSRGDGAAIALKVGDVVCQNDIIATAPDGRVSIRFIDGTSFTVSDDARVVVKEFVCGGASPSARFDVVSGTFAFIAGDIAKAGKFEIDTAVASIRGRARTGGIGMLTLTALMFAVMEEARADSPGQAFLDDGTITYNGVFEVTTKEAVPKHYVVDNPAESLVLQRIGSSVNADQMINSAQIMDQLHAAQQEALHIFSLGLAQGPTTTGPGGSGDPPLSGPPTFFQPINFTPPPSGGPPTGPSGPPNLGPPPIPTPLFLDVVFTPPPAAPGKINEIVGHTGDAAPDTTSSSLGLNSGPATIGTPTFAWSAGSLTGEQQTQLAAVSTLTLSDSGGFINFQYSAEDKTFDFLAATETLTVTYNVTAGGITQQAVITITGTNDTPMITSAAQIGTITEETNLHQPNPTGSSDLDKASGTVTFTDADLTDHHQIAVSGVIASGVTTGLADQATVLGWLTLDPLSDSTGGVTGSDVWTFSAQDKNFDYLAAGETLTLTYTVKVDDGNGGTATQDVTVTITGTNDTPVITSAAQIGTITEETNPHQPNPTGSSDLDKASGTVTFTDADLSDHHQVTVTGVTTSGVTTGLADQATVLGWLTLGALSDSTGGVTGSDAWTFSAQDKNFDYLAAGETLTLTYTVKVDDGHGGTATQDVAVTVTGTNDTPVINLVDHDSAAATLTESYKTLATSGTLTVTDVDLSDTVTATVKGVTLGGTTGGLTSANVLDMLSVTSGAIAADPADTHNLAWSFNSNPQAFGFLDAGESLTLTYTVQVNDGHGGIANQAVTITVNGTNQPDLVTSFTGIDSHGYFDEHAPAVEHVSDGGADVTAQASFQWQVLLPWFLGGQWITVSNSNSFSQVFYEGLQLRVTTTYAEAGGTDAITTYLGQISDSIFDDYGAPIRIQNLSNDLQVADGAALELAAATALAVFFPTSADAYGKLVIDDAGSYTGQIHNFAGTSTQSDAIDLTDIAYTSDLSLSYHDNSGHDTGGTLSILKSGHVLDTVKFADGDYSVDNFALSSDGHGGTIISDPPSPATGDANVALTAGTDTLALNGEAHSVTGTAQTVNNGDKISGSGADTLTIDSGNGDQNYTFGDGHHSDVGMTGIETLTLTDSAATGGHAIDVTFDSSFHNNGTLTVDGSALSHLDGANLTVDAHLVTADAFVFVGSSGADTLIGGAKADTIIGGGGGDTLTGGGGGDNFVFKAITDSQPGAGHFDVITDFTHNADHLDFSAIDGLNSSVQAVNFVAGTSAPGSLAAHTVDIVTSGADTVVYANAGGSAETAGHVDMEIHLHNVTNVQSSDFILHG